MNAEECNITASSPDPTDKDGKSASISFAEAKKELVNDLRKSLVRDASAVLRPSPRDVLVEAETEATLQQGRVLVNSQSAETVNMNESTKVKKPFISNLSQDVSAKNLTIAPSLFGQMPCIKGTAKEKLLQEKRIEMLHKPNLNKQSCNHCISKAVTKHEQAIERLAFNSLASTSGASTKASALNNAITEFLSVSPSTGHLPSNFSATQLQYDAQSYL